MKRTWADIAAEHEDNEKEYQKLLANMVKEKMEQEANYTKYGKSRTFELSPTWSLDTYYKKPSKNKMKECGVCFGAGEFNGSDCWSCAGNGFVTISTPDAEIQKEEPDPQRDKLTEIFLNEIY